MENNNYYNSQEYVKKILSELGVVYTKQLIIALCRRYNIGGENAFDVLKNMQKNRRLLMSQDGYTMSVGAYSQFVDDKFFDRVLNVTDDFAITFDVGKELNIDKELINCFWYVADVGEEAKDFVVCEYPWRICYNTEATEDKESYIYQIAYIPEKRESTTYHLLKAMPNIESDGFRNVVKRIAIIEKESHSILVPHVGFKEIYTLNEKGGLKLLETRNEDEAWGDYVQK